MTKRKWVGTPPATCDLCKEPIGHVFIDGKTTFGSWAFMDPLCHSLYGAGLGTGKGQKYQLQDGDWIKVEG
jgi:hypothetical protein